VESAGYRALIAIISEMGSGKTTVLKRLALELYSLGSIVLYCKETASDLSADEVHQFVERLEHENASRPIYLCIDDATRITNLSEFVSQLAEDGIKAVILLASRTSEWRDANLALTANLDYDPVEFLLSEHLTLHEVEELSSKLRLFRPHSKSLKFNSKKSILVTMMETTGGRGFHEIIKERIRVLHRKSDILLQAYEYTCLLNQFGLPMPISVLEALFPRNDILTEVVSQALFREVIQPSEDDRQITSGHELVAQSVIEQQYGTASSGLIVLVEMFTRLIQNIPSDLSHLTKNLLLILGRRNKLLVRKVIARSEQHLTELMQKSSANDLNRSWARVYESVGDYEFAQKCHLKSLEISEDSGTLARYAGFLRGRNQFLEAKRRLEQAIAIAPGDAGARNILGRLLKAMFLYKEAARQFESSLQLTPYNLYKILSTYLPVLLYFGQYERAEELCRDYLASTQPMKPGRRLAWQVTLIRILLLRNNTSAAQNEIEVIVTNRPQGPLKVAHILPKKHRRMLNLSAESIAEIQALFDGYQSNIESSPQTTNFPDKLLDDAGSLSSVILSSEANEEDFPDEESASKLNTLIAREIIEVTVKQLRNSGHPEAIPQYLKDIIQQSVWNTSAYTEYAKYLEELEKYAEAEDYLIAAIVFRNPDSSNTLLQYACFLVRHGRMEEARNYFQHSLMIPKHRFKQFAKGAADYVLELISSNNLQEAITICEQYTISLSEEQKMSIVDTLMSYGRYEYLERFARTYWATTTGVNKSEMVATLIIALVRQGRYQETLPYSGLILKKYAIPGTKQVRALAECAAYLVRQHVRKDCIQLINTAISRAPDNPYVLSAQIQWLIATRNFTKANQIIRRLLSSNPDFGLAHALRGQLLSWQGHTHQAYSAFEQAVTVQKQDSEALAKYCNFLIEESRLLASVDSYESTVLLNLALEQGQAAYQLEATNPYVVNNYAHALSLAGELEQADIVVQHMLNRSPSDASTLIQASEIKASKGQSSDAVKYYEAVISATSSFFRTRAHIGLGRLLLSCGDPIGAYEHLHKALELSKSGSQAKLAMAEVLVIIGSLDSAEVLFRQVAAHNPGFVQARLGLADLLVIMGQTAKALAAYTTFAIECWEVGRLLAIVRIGHTTFHLLNSSLDDKLQIVALATGLLAGRAARLNPYTQQTANRILRDVSNWLTAHPKTKEVLETQITDLEALLQASKIAKADESLATDSHEKILIQLLHSYLKGLASDDILMELEENSSPKA